MKTTYYLSYNGSQITVIGEVLEANKIKLSLENGKEVGIIDSHKDDLDNVQKQFLELFDGETNVSSNKVISPSDVIKGIEDIIEKYPETKGRLASLKSQVKNVFLKYNVLDWVQVLNL